jgi:hypothetical protein
MTSVFGLARLMVTTGLSSRLRLDGLVLVPHWLALASLAKNAYYFRYKHGREYGLPDTLFNYVVMHDEGSANHMDYRR